MFGKILGWLALYWETEECRFPDVDPAIYGKHISTPPLRPSNQSAFSGTRDDAVFDVKMDTERANANQGVYGRTNTLVSDEFDILLMGIADACNASHNLPRRRLLAYLAENLKRRTKENRGRRHSHFDDFKALIHEAEGLPPAFRPEILNTLVDTISDLEEDQTISAFDLAIDAVESLAPDIQAETLCRLCDSLKYLKLAGSRPHRLLKLIQNLNPEYRRDPLEHFGAATNFLREDLRSGLILQAISLSAECSSHDQSAIISSFARRCLNGLDNPKTRDKILEIMIDVEGVNGARGKWSDAHQNCLWYLSRATSRIEPLGESAAFARVHSLFHQIPSHLQRTIFRTLFSK